MTLPMGSLNLKGLPRRDRKFLRIGRRRLTSTILVEESGTFRVYARNTYTGYRNAYIHAVAPEYLAKIVAHCASGDMDVDHFHAKKSVKDNLDAIDDMGDDGEAFADPEGLVFILIGAASASMNRSYGADDDVETLIKKTAGLPMNASPQKVGWALEVIMGKADDAGGSALGAGYVLPRDGVAWSNVSRINGPGDLTPSEQSTLETLF